MNSQKKIDEVPEFLVKSTQWVALASIVILLPFCIFNFIQNRFLLGGLTTAVVLVCFVNSWYCWRGIYCYSINLFAVVPAITVAITMAIFQLDVRGSYWAFLGVFAIYYILPEKLAWKVNVVFDGIICIAAYQVLEKPVAIRFIAILLGTSFFAFAAIHEIYRQHFKLKKQAVLDPLTRLYKRFLLQDSLEHAVTRNRRAGNPVSLIMLDLDHFKAVNDQFGHDTGDRVLKAVGRILSHNFRVSDMPFRIGGEEFLIILYNTDSEGCFEVARKLQKEIQSLSILPDRSVTASIGISTLFPGMDREAWLKKCDENLYRAKNSGRNCVVV
ncbi:GGDEF domain-containing protein [Desulfomarina sp.]